MTSSAKDTMTAALLWKNKTTACDTLREFEALRKKKLDHSIEQDKAYWQTFEAMFQQSNRENMKLLEFFNAKLQADETYAESLWKLRTIIDPNIASSMDSGTCTTIVSAAVALGDTQQQLSEKIKQFISNIKRDVIARSLEDMMTKYQEQSASYIQQGTEHERRLLTTQKQVHDAYEKYDTLFRQLQQKTPAEAMKSPGTDLWLLEMDYYASVCAFRSVCLDYVKGMSSIYLSFKKLETMRIFTVQAALETYIRKQRLLFTELSGCFEGAKDYAQRIFPEKDVSTLTNEIPKNHIAVAVSNEIKDGAILFASLASPLVSPLVLHRGYLRRQIVGSIFKSWKDCLCILTQDLSFHVFEIPEGATLRWEEETIQECILHGTKDSNMKPASPSSASGLVFSINMKNSKIRMLLDQATRTTDGACFEIAEAIATSGVISMFKTESVKRHVFQCKSQAELLQWIDSIQ